MIGRSGRIRAKSFVAAALCGSFLSSGAALAQSAPTETSPDNAANAGVIVVTGVQFNDNVVESVYKMPLEAKDIPQSVKVFTPDILQFASVDRFEKIYKLDASAHPSHPIDGYSRNYYRGFLADSDNAFRIDGMRAFGILDLSFASFERLELIKGSTSTLYGRAVIGGTTNAVSKKPTEHFQFSGYAEGGTYDHYQAGIDVSGPISGDGNLRGRLVGNYLDTGSHIDYFYKTTAVIAPSFQYEFSPDTVLTIQGNYQNDDFLPLGNFGAQVIDDDFANPDSYVIPDVPRGRLANFTDAYNESEMFYVRGLFETKLSDWSLRVNGYYASLDIANSSGQGTVTYADGSTDFEIFGGWNQYGIYAGEVTLFGDVELLGANHTLFFGADYYKSTSLQWYGYAGVVPFSVYDPDYEALGSAEFYRDLRNYSINPDDPFYNPLLGDNGAYSEVGALKGLNEEVGATAQAILRPTDKWTLILGGRYSYTRGGRSFISCYMEEDCSLTFLDETVPEAPTSSASAFTMQLGTTYAITPDINLYASYGETFTPRFEEFAYDPNDPDGVMIAPEDGVAYEVGAKGVHAGGKFSWSVALFDISRTNISQEDPAHPGFSLLLGKQRSRGIELDAQGELMEGWQLYSSFSIMDNEFVEGEFEGYKAFFAPKAGASIYTSYELLRGSLAGLSFGGGVVYKKLPTYASFFGDAQGLPLTNLNPGDILEVDASVTYTTGRWNFGVQATNLFDTRYYTPTYPSPFYSLNVNPGRQVIGRIGFTF